MVLLPRFDSDCLEMLALLWDATHGMSASAGSDALPWEMGFMAEVFRGMETVSLDPAPPLPPPVKTPRRSLEVVGIPLTSKRAVFVKTVAFVRTYTSWPVAADRKREKA